MNGRRQPSNRGVPFGIRWKPEEWTKIAEASLVSEPVLRPTEFIREAVLEKAAAVLASKRVER